MSPQTRHSLTSPMRLFTCLLFLLLVGCASPSATPDIENTSTPTATIPTATITFTPTATTTFTVTPTATNTPRPTRTPTFSPTRTATLTPAGTLTPTISLKPTGPFKAVLRLQEITPGQITDIYIPPAENQVLLAGTFGMARIDLDSLQVQSARFWGKSLGLDRSGLAWALPPDGSVIAAWEDNNWREYGIKTGWVIPGELPDTLITTSKIVPGVDNTIWLATASDVRRFDGRQWFIYPATSTGINLPYKFGVQSALTVAASQTTDEAWAGSCNWQTGNIISGGGLRYFDGWRWQESGFPNLNACILFLQAAPTGQVWAASGSDLWIYDADNQAWQQFSPPPLPESQQYSHILDLVLDPAGKACPLLRIEDEGGHPLQEIRYCLSGKEWRDVRILPPLATQALRFLPDGTLLSFEEGIVQILQPDNIWKPLVEMEYNAFTVGPGSTVWLVNHVKTRPVVWRAELSLYE